jgi:cytochrome c-type biogenesis protein
MFGIDLIDAGMLPAMTVALAAGVLSFLSPCVLPIVPPYLAYMGGISMAEFTGAGHAPQAGAAAGLVLRAGPVHGVPVPGLHRLGLRDVLPAKSGTFLADRRRGGDRLRAAFRGPVPHPDPDREARMDAGDRGGSAFGAYVLGLAFAFGWTPCIGPQLGAILSLAATESSVSRGTTLLGVYAMGLGLPFLLAAVFVDRSMTLMNRLKKHMKTIERAMGALLLVVGVALVTGAFSDFSWWLLETFPSLATLG